MIISSRESYKIKKIIDSYLKKSNCEFENSNYKVIIVILKRE